jgi:hypothetical protein
MARSYLSIFSTLVLFSGVTFAATQDEGPQYSAHYSDNYLRLASMFDEGKSFDFVEAIGWYSGRCWRAHSEMALSGLLVLDERKTDGPLFDAVKKFSFYHEWPDQPENFFDTYTDDSHRAPPRGRISKHDSMVRSWREVIASRFLNDWNDISKVTDADGGGFTDAFQRLAPMVVRRSADDKYFLLKRGDTIICYFFKSIPKVDPPPPL